MSAETLRDHLRANQRVTVKIPGDMYWVAERAGEWSWLVYRTAAGWAAGWEGNWAVVDCPDVNELVGLLLGVGVPR